MTRIDFWNIALLIELEFAKILLQRYIRILFGTSVPFRIMNKLFGNRLKRKISEEKRLLIRNIIECEAHRELIL